MRQLILILAFMLAWSATAIAAPTASLSCPATAFVDEPVVCDGSASTGVNGQAGWSTRVLADGRSAVLLNFGDGLGAYSLKRLLKAPHAYRTAGTYTVTLTVWDSAGVSDDTTASITVSNIPAATGGNIQTLTDLGSTSANCTALQNAINTAYAGNTVEKEIHLPVITYTCGLNWPAFSGTKYVTIRPTSTSWLPTAQVRVTPSLAANMPKIQSPGTDQTQVTIGGADRGYLRLIGIEFNKSGSGHLHQFITIGSGATNYTEIPRNIIIKHCYFHGNAFDNTVRAIFVNADKFSLLDSYIEDMHAEGEEAQGLSGFAGSGMVIDNNYIVGLSQGILFGGADAGVKFQATCASGTSSTGCTLNSAANVRVGDGISLPVAGGRGPWSASIVRSIAGNAITFDQITNQAGTPTAPDTTANAVRFGASPQDILVSRNYFFKSLIYKCTDNPVEGQPCIPDPTYNGSYRPVVKNIFELKHAMRVVVVGNVMQNHWGQQGQPGPSVLFTPRNQTCYLLTFPHDPVTCPEQTNPWAMVRDVDFEANKVLNVADWIDIIGTDNLNPPGTGDEAGPSAFTQYIRAANNLVITNGSGMNGSGSMAFIFPGAKHVALIHNTVDDPSSDSSYILGSTEAPIGLTTTNGLILNNIFKHREYGFIGDGFQAANFMSTFFPDGKATHNVISDEQGLVGGENWSTAQITPNYFPATIDTNTFISRATGNYRLKSDSPYKAGNATPAADGTDIGVNFDTVTAAALNAVTGNWSAQITAVTANLQHGEGTDAAQNFSRQITALAGADLIAVQERTTGETGWDAPMSAAGFVQAEYRENHPNQGDGPAIWYNSSTVTVQATYETDLQVGTLIGWDGSTVVNKAAVAAKVTVSGKQFYFVSTHLCWSACADAQFSQFSAQREGQITTLLNWINSNLTGGLDIIIAGDMNFGPDYPKVGGGLIKSMFTASYDDLWNVGLTAGTATTPWDDRDGVNGVDMTPADIGTQTTGTRTHDTRRIDYIFLKQGATALALNTISVPDGRAQCSVALTLTDVFKECPDTDAGTQRWDVTDDQGVRPSDHNFVVATFTVSTSTTVRKCKWGRSPKCQ